MKEAKQMCATCDEICHYIEEEVKPGDTVRLSLGRCYIPGKVVTNNEGVIQIEMESEMIKGLSTIDVAKMKDFLVELEHECPDGMCCTIEAKDD
ncbi:DUF2097 domain-containing protein [Methanobacterium sp.]|uniref:DUF2097 domain-containing protein n=1 Tax=Methanobacterium sp. TaxID=2164 RepID=UPI002ABC549B|nr:DUF2097 family protein [Methanobacterium sp.]MDY9923717.1 DUF2097 family protein [Methanobacterium sp.]